ncbi:MAG: hypothetical protein ACO3O0_00450 [Bacteroidia bacterium]
MNCKIPLLLFLVLTFSNCNDQNKAPNDIESENADVFSAADSIPTVEELEIERDARENVDSMIRHLHKKTFMDSTGMDKSPVVVVSAKLFKEAYSNYKSIKLTYKNNSDKTIQAIRFEWYGENAFGEPADMGSPLIEGSGGGFTEETLRPGKTGSGVWSILSRDGKKILMARAYEVAFDDGSSWKLRAKP